MNWIEEELDWGELNSGFLLKLFIKPYKLREVRFRIPINLMLEKTYGEGGCYVEALGTIHRGELALFHYLNGLTPGFDDGPPQLHLYDMKTKQFRTIDFVFPDSWGMYDINWSVWPNIT